MHVRGSADDFKEMSGNGGTIGISSSIPSCTGLSCGIHVGKGVREREEGVRDFV